MCALLPGVFAAAGCTLFNAPMPVLQAPVLVRVDCATAAVVGLRWSAASDAAKPAEYRIMRDGQSLGATAGLSFADTGVAAASKYIYRISALDSSGNAAVSEALELTTPPAERNGDAPACPSQMIHAMTWDWPNAYRAAEGSDLWPVTWGRDGNVYAFFGDGGGFGGDDHRGRTSFGIAMIRGRPPLSASNESNLYGGIESRHAAALSGKARSIIAVGADFYAIAGIYRSTDPKFREAQPISGSPAHLEIAYSRRNAYSWKDAGWTFCTDGEAASSAQDAFCPAGFINFGSGNAGSPGHYVYMLGNSPRADSRLSGSGDSPAARTYLARVAPDRILVSTAYQYFAGLDSRSRPVWNGDADRMQPVFIDRNAPQPGCGGRCSMSASLEEAVYNFALKRFIGVAQGGYLAQTSFYEAANPWGPWTTIAYQNIDPASGEGGWGNLGTAAGESLGVHIVNAWTGSDGLSLWVTYSSDGQAPSGGSFPPPGSKLDAFHLLRVDLRLSH
jgi:hypothetical protein